MNAFAITDSSYRVISGDMPLAPGETRVDVVPESVLRRIRADAMRFERNQLLRSTDWTQMADSSLTAGEKLAVAAYRKLLRDMPDLPGYPDVDWPTMPELPSNASDEISGGNIKPNL